MPEPSVFEVELPIEKLKKATNHQVLTKSQPNGLKQGVEQSASRSINLFILSGGVEGVDHCGYL